MTFIVYSHSGALIYTSIYRHALKDTTHINRHLGIFLKKSHEKRVMVLCNWNLEKLGNIKLLKLEEWHPCEQASFFSWFLFSFHNLMENVPRFFPSDLSLHTI